MNSTFEKRCSPPHHKNVFHAVFRQRKRESKESHMDYGSDVVRPAVKAYAEFNYTALDQVARDQFVRGLPDIDMKKHRGRISCESRESTRLGTRLKPFCASYPRLVQNYT